MGLQVRVRHALGDRLIELPDRDIDNPVTVGRASGVEVQVPSVGVAPRHCVLFRYDGHWAVQDVGAANDGSTSGTYVNGHQVVDPVMLQIGDVISVGSEASAPTIEVDPAAAAEGRSGWAGDDATTPLPPGYAVPGVPGYTASHPDYSAAAPGSGYGGYPAPAVVPTVPAVAPAPSAWAAPAPVAGAYGAPSAGYAAPAADDQADLGAYGAEAAAPYRRSGHKKKPRTSETAMIVGILAAAVIIGGTAWIVYEKTKEPEVAVAPPPKPPADGGNVRHRANMFDGTSGSGSGGSGSSSTLPPTASVTPTPPTPTPIPTPPTPAPAHNPSDTSPPSTPADSGTKPPETSTEPKSKPSTPDEMASGGTPSNPGGTGKPTPPAGPATPAEAWQEMEDLHSGSNNPAIALFRLNDFAKQHPGQHADDIKSFMEDKLDQLWWERIDQLFRKRDRLLVDIKKKQDAIWEETDAAMKKQEKDEKDDLEKKLKVTKEQIAVKMGYAAEEPPPLTDRSALATLREKRDAAKYAEWEKNTLRAIVNDKGKTGWEADN